uniref:Uncharacterized protein n=1 Tax=Solanum tuberosum TaxID=4113 RepID=M1DW89_SOLTU
MPTRAKHKGDKPRQGARAKGKRQGPRLSKAYQSTAHHHDCFDGSWWPPHPVVPPVVTTTRGKARGDSFNSWRPRQGVLATGQGTTITLKGRETWEQAT